ncbi:MAG: hypothetical protein JWO13_676 [Acidobacteriales bacterium]|nr:hypothetical protein [Terriglobales bacterium]
MIRAFRNRASLSNLITFVVITFIAILPLAAREITPEMYSSMKWRSIGPFRAGRVSAIAGVPIQTAVYYIGTPGGGVWKTTNAGQTWKPIFDSVPVSSIGTVVVSPSNPNIVYVGTGEQTQGNGVYKSTDAGATWKNVGLEKTHIITGMEVDPKNPDIVIIAAAGDFFSGAERGIFKTTDGGKSWKKVLFKGEDTSPMDLNMAAGNPKVMYTAMLKRPTPPPAGTPFNQNAPREQDATIYKSTDEGSTWSPVGGKGLPTDPMGRVGIAAAPGASNKTVFAIATQGVFRSDDGGATWTQTTKDARVIGNGYFSRIFVDPTNANTVYVAQTSMYRSTDGGKNFEAWVGAPSGDDYHLIWINPSAPQNILLGVDQGAVISNDSGATWSSWYNQPTGQFYHVSTDNHFPYFVYAAQQDSGTMAVASRSDYGEITDHDWAPTGGFEFSFIAPDPLNANLVYTGGWYGSVLRYDKITGQVVHIFVRTPKYRTANMAPIAFSPQNPRILYIGAQYVLETTDGGDNWREISPDLTVKADAAAAAPAGGRGAGRGNANGVINTMAVSTLKAGQIWVGTTNGLIQVTRDGRTWQDVTPAGLPERSSVNAIEASRHDPAEAYAVINAFRDARPYIYRTRDFGKSWQAITAGIPESPIARIVREDTVRKGLLYAGTEAAAFVSFDDGDHWRPLQLNLPTTPVRDMEVHGDDLVIATYGRSLWILDNLTPLRQADNKLTQADATLLKPANAIRARWDMNQDTPLPVETPAGKNPPDGAIIDYYLKAAPGSEIKLAIYDSQNELVREYSGTVAPIDKTPMNVPGYWFMDPAVLSKAAGHNRFVWDMRYEPPKTMRYSYYGNRLDYIEYTLADHAIPGETPREQPLGPLVTPGEYTVALTVGGQTYKQPLTITLDPRVHVSQADLVLQLNAEKSISAQMAATYDGSDQVTALRTAITDRQTQLAKNPAAKDAADAIKALDERAMLVADGSRTELGLGPLNRELARLATMIESGDARPASALQASVDQSCEQLGKRLASWHELNGQIASVNSTLQKYSVAALPVASNIPAAPACK